MNAVRRLSVACLVALVPEATAAWASDGNSWRDKLPACLACHGQDGISRMPGVPSLAGQPDLFIQWQLVYFRDAIRPSDIMVPLAQALDDAEVRAMGAYFASLPAATVQESKDTAAELSTRGGELVAAGRCANCHLPSFAGQGEMPRLAGQREEVLVKALTDYKSGVRRGRGNAAMPEITFGLGEEDIKALAHYLSRL
jgi:cytochrome c553